MFPSYCLCCEAEVEGGLLLCAYCSAQLEFLEESPFAVAPFTSIAVSMGQVGPSSSFIRGVHGPYSIRIAEAMSAFMAVTLSRQDWPMPDVIIPSPRDLVFNRHLASSLSLFLEIPVIEALKPPSSFYRGEEFRWNLSHSLSGQTVLVADYLYDSTDDRFQILEEAAIQESFFLGFS